MFCSCKEPSDSHATDTPTDTSPRFPGVYLLLAEGTWEASQGGKNGHGLRTLVSKSGIPDSNGQTPEFGVGAAVAVSLFFLWFRALTEQGQSLGLVWGESGEECPRSKPFTRSTNLGSNVNVGNRPGTIPSVAATAATHSQSSFHRSPAARKLPGTIHRRP